MKVLIDTNVILDVILKRQPFYDFSAKVLELADKGVEEYISASAVTDIFYLAYRDLKDRDKVIGLMKDVLEIAKIISVSEKEIFNAFDLNWKDFEDAVQHSAALSNGIDIIVTRNMKGFSQAEVKICTPEEVIQFIDTKEN